MNTEQSEAFSKILIDKALEFSSCKLRDLWHVEGVPDKKAMAGLKEAQRKLDELYRDVVGRKDSVGAREKETGIA